MPSFFTKYKNKTFLCLVLVCVFLFCFLMPKVLSVRYISIPNTPLVGFLVDTVVKEEIFIPSYIATPESVKGIYMTSWTSGDRNFRDSLVKLIEDTELNTIVIDIKDYSGKITFPLIDNSALKSFGSEEVRVRDLRDFIESLHKKNIYVIARVAVFQDEYFVKYRPDLAVKNKTGESVWKDRKGISWIDPGAQEYWDYIILLANEARKIGFDEINFDYIRFPSDGNMQDISYPFSSSTPKHIVMKNFFRYLNENIIDRYKNVDYGPNLSEPDKNKRLKISADLFGMVTTATSDMGIGQILEDALPYFDYIMPMVYPSHYPATFQGFKNPAQHPYEVVYFAMQEGVRRANLASTTPNKLRPWIQDFDLGANYGPEEVRDQIRATNDVGLNSWILWSPSNRYTKGALNEN